MQAASGDDYIYGSEFGASLWARCMGGNDRVSIYSGMNNFVNGNMGNDKIKLYASTRGAYGQDGNILGGRDHDTIDIYGGEWGLGQGMIINGNQGDDVLVNWTSATCHQLHGGAGNDRITNYGNSNVWGDLGADVFIPAVTGLMVVQDFVVGEDTVLPDHRGIGYTINYSDVNNDGVTDTCFESPLSRFCVLLGVTL